jgi:hypothetical protein
MATFAFRRSFLRGLQLLTPSLPAVFIDELDAAALPSFFLLFFRTLSKAYSGTSAILVDELNAGESH